MRLIQNFIEVPGSGDMAKPVLGALLCGDHVSAVPLACRVAKDAPKYTYEELNALCATILGKSGHIEAGLDYWDKAIRKAPQRLDLLQRALMEGLEGASSKAEATVNNWLSLLERVYSNVPDVKFLAELTARGWKGRGSVGICNGRIKGWVWCAGTPELKLAAEKKLPTEIRLDPVQAVQGRILYKLDSPLPETSNVFTIHVLADGQHVTGSPVTVSPSASVKPNRDAANAELSLIIPAYDDYENTLSCIGNVLASLRKNKRRAQILVAWDNGPNRKLQEKLRGLARRGKIQLFENPHNFGFLATVNALLAETRGDAILLNSDTIVHGDWIDRFACAAEAGDVATITALGNEAELMSFPGFSDRGVVKGLKDVRVLDNAARKIDSDLALVELPTGVGFCMYITRNAINRIGGLDGRFLFRGYGEEVDYCLRASEAGLKNYGLFNLFVGHIGERSFGLGKKALAAQNNELIFVRFPEHEKQYEQFLEEERPKRLKEAISRNILLDLEIEGELEVRPWSARCSPPWLRDKGRQPGKKGVALFLQGGANPRALLRAWQKVPLADLRFDLRESAQELEALLAGMGINSGLSYLKSDGLISLARSLGLDLKEPQAGDPLQALPANFSGTLLVAQPDSMANWATLMRFARKHPDSMLFVQEIGINFGNAPLPENIQELKLFEDYRPFSFSGCLLWDSRDREGWADWLKSRKCDAIPFYKLRHDD